MLRRLREAVREDGLNGPYAQQLLKTTAVDLNTPLEWTQLACAILTPGQMVNWKACYNEEFEIHADLNHRQGVQFRIESMISD